MYTCNLVKIDTTSGQIALKKLLGEGARIALVYDSPKKDKNLAPIKYLTACVRHFIGPKHLLAIKYLTAGVRYFIGVKPP